MKSINGQNLQTVASEQSYDNGTSGLAASTTQAAIDEVVAESAVTLFEKVGGSVRAVTETDDIDLRDGLLKDTNETSGIEVDKILTTTKDQTVSASNTYTATQNMNDILFDTTPIVPATNTEGEVYWNATDNCLDVMTGIDDVILQVGQELLVKVINKSGSTITNGAVVYVSGVDSGRPSIELADATVIFGKVIGITTNEILDDEEGFVTISGLVRGIDTNAFSAGDVLYISDTTPGAFRNTAPSAPNKAIIVGFVITKSATVGTILVRVDNQANLKANDSEVVHNTGTETIAGAKTFSDALVVNDLATFETAKIGGATHYAEFEADGTLKLNGDATYFEDINLAGAILRVGASAPSFTQIGTSGLYEYAFSGTSDKEVHGTIELPHSYKEGSDISFHIHWMPSTSETTKDVVWELTYQWVNRDGTMSGTTSTTVLTTAVATGTTAYVKKDSSTTLTGTGKTISSHINFKLTRKATDSGDTYTQDVFLIAAGIHYESDTLGSRQITTK